MDSEQDGQQPPAIACDQSREAGQIGELAASSHGLIQAVGTLDKTVVRLIARDKVTRRWAAVAVIGVLSTLLLAGISAIVWNQTYVTEREQVRTRTQVLCPLYTMFLGAVSPTRAASLTPQQRQALKVIEQGYAVLGCAATTPAPPPH